MSCTTLSVVRVHGLHIINIITSNTKTRTKDATMEKGERGRKNVKMPLGFTKMDRTKKVGREIKFVTALLYQRKKYITHRSRDMLHTWTLRRYSYITL